MIPKKPVPDLIRDGYRFSEKIMPKQLKSAESDSTQLNQTLEQIGTAWCKKTNANAPAPRD
jgi:hypothetical protein